MSESVAYFLGRWVDEMSREELIAVINWQEERYQRETASLRESRSSWMHEAFSAHRARLGYS